MLGKEPKISVIVPMYNAEKYVGFCLDSIFNQTFQDYEIILIDDASEDRTFEICERMSAGKPAVNLLKNIENKGQWYCRNKGGDIAKGKYIYFMDSDDELLPNALAVFYDKIEEENADVAYANIYYTSYAEGRMLSRFSMAELNGTKDLSEGLLKGTPAEIMEKQHFEKQPMPWLKLIRKDFLKENRITFYPLSISEDDVYSVEVALKAKKIICFNEPVYIYRKYYHEKDRITKRLPKALPLMVKVIESYNDLFSQFSQEEIPFSLRLNAITGWLRAHLNFWIFDILDTGKKEDFLALKNVIYKSTSEGGMAGELVPLLVHLLQIDSNIKALFTVQRDKQRERLEKRMDDAESKGQGNDYPLIYSLAKRASLLEGYEETFYAWAYKCLAVAAFELGKYSEAWEAYGKAIDYAAENMEKEELLSARKQIGPYLDKNIRVLDLNINYCNTEKPTDELTTNSTMSKVVIGTCAHYFSITDDMLRCWKEIMEQLPWASLVIVCEEFIANAMMVEAAERLMRIGFRPECVRFEPLSAEWYRELDIVLDTYPVSQGERLKVALAHGVPFVTLWGDRQESRDGEKVLSSVGLEELASDNPHDYILKVVSLGNDVEFLELLKTKLPEMLKLHNRA